MARTLKSPLFGTTIPFGRAAEFEATLPHPERTARKSVQRGEATTYIEYPTRGDMLTALWRLDQRGGPSPHEVVPCPHGVRHHC